MKQKPWQWWHLRLTFSTKEKCYGYVEAKQFGLHAKIIAITNQYLVVYEVSGKEKPHLHMNFLSNLSESKLRSYLIPGDLGRMDKYLKEIKLEEIYPGDCYICKGDGPEQLPVVMVKSNLKYTEEYIKQCHEEYWKVNSESKKQSKNCTFIDLVVNDLNQEYKNKVWSASSYADRKLVLNAVLFLLGKKAKGFDSIVVKRLMNGVLNILDRHGMTAYMEMLIFDHAEREALGM